MGCLGGMYWYCSGEGECTGEASVGVMGFGRKVGYWLLGFWVVAGVNTPRCDEARLELMELTVLLLPKVEKVRIGVSAVDLQCMSAKRTSWNEFSSSMASAIIYLSSGDLSTHTTKYTSPALTQKVFANMRRVGKGFSGVETSLFEGMLVDQQVEEGDADENVENVNAGDTAEGDVSAAHDEVPTVAEELSILSPTPPTTPP
nr:hypothetical protein [Tanacetum cinerariifolium]